MTKRDYEELAKVLATGYSQILDPAERRGYNYAIHAIIQFSADQNSRFDAIKFSAAVYQTQSHKKQS